MTTLLRTLTATLIITILSAIPTFAQSSLDKIIEPLKDGDKGSSVVYREKRNPTTKAIIESALLVEFNDSKLANKIIETMKKERQNAANFSSYDNRNNKNYKIEYHSKNGDSSEYCIFLERNKWTLTVKVYRPSAKKRR
ncbi:MAG: hypothetical protein OSJ41_02510 [Duncaniella sp.]|jgi:hypothetical protein|uniref:hypothetical protein n=1 Tax=Duncaniella muricolitica TaxID=2880704 RepID=UPI000F467806|nr:hypothetical protein [Duncaniella muricolitica]MCX4368365.1 hypothetical protein [Duncaniella sp.]MDE5928419.1 hypothetical protein [Duncaniella sp.]ROT20374.1 hypothetical protein EEL51_06410 [Muribaculaceae bacterium Isolate-110 (HZI)]